jgi:cell division protein FtsQ
MLDHKNKIPLRKNKALDRQRTAKPKRRRDFSGVFKLMQLLGSAFLKFSYLVFALILISLLFISGYEFLQQAPYVKLQNIMVSGMNNDLKRALLESAGLNAETSLLSVNIDQVKRVMEANPWIRNVELEKRYPHTLVIRAEEQKVRAVVFQERFQYINQYGEAFKDVAPGEPLDYPIITGIELKPENGSNAFQRALNVLDILEVEKSPWSVRDLAEIHIQEEGNIVLYFCSFPVAIEVRENDLANKMEDLKKVVTHLRNSGQWTLVRKIDLNYIEGIVVSYKKSKQPNLNEMGAKGLLEKS